MCALVVGSTRDSRVPKRQEDFFAHSRVSNMLRDRRPRHNKSEYATRKIITATTFEGFALGRSEMRQKTQNAYVVKDVF